MIPPPKIFFKPSDSRKNDLWYHRTMACCTVNCVGEFSNFLNMYATNLRQKICNNDRHKHYIWREKKGRLGNMNNTIIHDPNISSESQLKDSLKGYCVSFITHNKMCKNQINFSIIILDLNLSIPSLILQKMNEKNVTNFCIWTKRLADIK